MTGSWVLLLTLRSSGQLPAAAYLGSLGVKPGGSGHIRKSTPRDSSCSDRKQLSSPFCFSHSVPARQPRGSRSVRTTAWCLTTSLRKQLGQALLRSGSCMTTGRNKRRSEAGADISLRKASKKLTAAANEAVQYFLLGTQPRWVKAWSFTQD